MTFESVQAVNDASVQFAIKTGRMSDEGTILGGYKNSTITLNKDLASNFTRDHETFHFLEDAGMVNDGDRIALDREFSQLKKGDRLTFKPNTLENKKLAKEENRANTFAQILEAREESRGTPLGRIIQKIADFLEPSFIWGGNLQSKWPEKLKAGMFIPGMQREQYTKRAPVLSTSEDMTIPPFRNQV